MLLKDTGILLAVGRSGETSLSAVFSAAARASCACLRRVR